MLLHATLKWLPIVLRTNMIGLFVGTREGAPFTKPDFSPFTLLTLSLSVVCRAVLSSFWVLFSLFQCLTKRNKKEDRGCTLSSEVSVWKLFKMKTFLSAIFVLRPKDFAHFNTFLSFRWNFPTSFA